MTTASLSIYDLTGIADTQTRLHVSIKPRLSVNPSELNAHYHVQRPERMPHDPTIRCILEALQENPHIEVLHVTDYGVDVYHYYVQPSVIIELIRTGIARAKRH